MSRFLEPLKVELQEDGTTWKTLEAMDYEVGKVGSGEKIDVPAGTMTDFGSVPRGLWWLISPIGTATRPFVLHDFLYAVHIYTRVKSDAVLLEALGVVGLPWLYRHTVWAGVRVGGWVAWNKHKRENIKSAV